ARRPLPAGAQPRQPRAARAHARAARRAGTRAATGTEARGGVSTPALSVVIAAHNARSVIDACLRALRDQPGSAAIEVIVADGSPDGPGDFVVKQFPHVHLLRFDPALNVPELRGRAIAQARAPVIAVLDPFSVASPDWIEQTIDAHRRLP